VRGEDYVWVPFSKQEFEQLPRWRQVLEHVYRHPFGPGLYYALEIWWKKLWFPSARQIERQRLAYWLDSLLVTTLVQVSVLALGRSGGNVAEAAVV
jgi:acyl-lipid omega-6 desaturase (Delta-12 desaturase)